MDNTTPTQESDVVVDGESGADGEGGSSSTKPKLTRMSSVNRRILEAEESTLWDNLDTFNGDTDTDTMDNTAPTTSDTPATTTHTARPSSGVVVEDLDSSDGEGDDDDGDDDGEDAVPLPVTVSVDPGSLTAEDYLTIDKLGRAFTGVPLTKEECRKLVTDMYLSCGRNEAEAQRLLQLARAQFDAELQQEDAEAAAKEAKKAGAGGKVEDNADDDEDDEDGEDFFVCDKCDKELEVTDIVWHCQTCPDFDLCDGCMQAQRTTPFHQQTHTFSRLQTQGEDTHSQPHTHSQQQQPQPQSQQDRPAQIQPAQPPITTTATPTTKTSPSTTPSSEGVSPLLIGALVLAGAAVGWYFLSKRTKL